MSIEAVATTTVADSVASVRGRIAAACARAGRAPTEVTLLAASKTRSPEEVVAAIAAGVTDFGENRVEEAGPKMAAVADLVSAAGLAEPRWHLIGHLQSRKARTAVGPFDLIHSVDTLRLGTKLALLARDRGLALNVLIEINLGDEESKFGFPPPDEFGEPSGELRQAVEALIKQDHLCIVGLMGMAPLTERAEETRPYFRRLYLLRQALRRDYAGADWHHLSMGMTGDFETAIEEGATLVRIGRALFGAREAG